MYSKHRRLFFRGQALVEFAFALLWLLFFVFFAIQFSLIWQSSLVARYAAFMSARSLQVWGSTVPQWQEDEAVGSTSMIPFQKVFEDIYTCSLPWVTVPVEDRRDPNSTDFYATGCGAEGLRKYQFGTSDRTNLYREARARPYSTDASAVRLDRVMSGFHQHTGIPQDLTLRYGVLILRYRVPYLFNIFPTTSVSLPSGESLSDVFVDQVSVPLVLNPGLVVNSDRGPL